MHNSVKLVVLFGVLALSGCDKFFSMNIKDICEKHPQMCTDLNPDGWCRAQKANIITHRYEQLMTPSDMVKYKLLLDFEDYLKCVSKAAQIEHIKLKEKKSGRVRGIVTAQNQLKQLAEDTRNSMDPHLRYYHWSRLGDQEALEHFLGYMKRGKLETPELQIALASYFIKKDLKETIKALYHALELYQEDDEVNTDIFKSLTTIFMKQEKFSNAFIWAYIAREFDVEDVDLVQIESIISQSGKSINRLRNLADSYIDEIEEGRFVAPL